MKYDTGLAQRISEYLASDISLQEKKMFGGVCFMIRQHMCCGVVKDKLVARVGPDYYEQALKKPFVSVMDFTTRPMKGMVYVDAKALDEDQTLHTWLIRCRRFVDSLPDKK